MDSGPSLNLALVHYAERSGVTGHVSLALAERGHRITSVSAVGPLEPRDPQTGRLRINRQVALHLLASGLRFGRKVLNHRWNTTYAFDVHTRTAAAALRALPEPPDLVLQHGTLFSPGDPPPFPYVLFLDHTRALSMEQQPVPEAGLPPPLDYGPSWRARETAVYRGARSIATFSRRVAESLQRDYGVPGERVHVVGAGANVYPESVERGDDGETILFVGKDFRRKGGPILLRAFERVRRLRPSARLVIAGPRERLSLPTGATQLGEVPMDRLVSLFARSTVFTLPTLREPYGIAFLDAMACGLPCVGTTVGAVPEIIDHGQTGILVPPRNEAALADALLTLLADPALAQGMGEHGRAVVETRRRWSHVAERIDVALRGDTVNSELGQEQQVAM